MFFRKKKEAPPAPPAPEREELTILMVTGANGFNGSRSQEDGLWRGGVELTAWMEEDGEEVHTQPTRLQAVGDERLMEYLRRYLTPDSLLQATVVPGKEADVLGLAGLPRPAFEPRLKAILDRQKEPVEVTVEEVGVFALDRRLNWLSCDLPWRGAPIQVTMEPGDGVEAQRRTFLALRAEAEDWERRVRYCAADQLLELARAWAEDGEKDGGAAPLTREEFLSRLELESIQLTPEGFAFWFADGDLFWGHAVQVSGTLEQGPVHAEMMG